VVSVVAAGVFIKIKGAKALLNDINDCINIIELSKY
jgi:hypothetical protein